MIVLLAYLNFALGGIDLSERLSLVLAFAIGPVAIVGLLDYFRKLSDKVSGGLLQTATVFLVIAFALLNLMLVVQQSIFSFYSSSLAGAESESAKELVQIACRAVNPVQLGIDVSFDIFYCLGIIFLSSVFLGLNRIHKFIGMYGILSAGLLLTFNIYTFPIPPADAGLIDIGPFTIIFWAGLIAGDFIDKRRVNKKAAD